MQAKRPLWLLLPILLAVGLASAHPRLFRQEKRGRVSNPGRALSFLPSGSGASLTQDLCDAFAIELTGNYFCLRGDGTQYGSDAGTLTDGGSPVLSASTVCPNGPDCGTVNSIGLNGSNTYFSTRNIDTIAGDFSACVLVQSSAVPTQSMLIAKDKNGGASRVFEIEQAAGGSFLFATYKNDATNKAISSAVLAVNGAWQLVCGVYDYVSDGASLMSLYVDGVSVGTPVTTAEGPLQVASTPIQVFRREYAGFTNVYTGKARAALFTEKALSATTIANMSNAARGTVQGSYGEAVTLTRSSAKTCTSSSGAVSTVPANVPCIASGGLNSEVAKTNLAIYSEDWTNGAYTTGAYGNYNVATVAADSTTAPDGTATADRVTFGNATSGIGQIVAATATQTYECSFYIKAGTATAVRLAASTGLLGVMVRENALQVVVTPSSAWTRYSGLVTMGALEDSLQCQVKITDGAQNGLTVFVWGTQVERNTFPTSYIRTVATAVTRTADVATLVKPGGLSVSEGCARACITPDFTTADTEQDILGFGTGASNTGSHIMYLNADTYVTSYDGTNGATVTNSNAPGVRTCYLTQWSSSRALFGVTNLTTGSTGSQGAFTGYASLGSTVVLGGNLGGKIDGVRIGTSWEGCE